MGLFFGTDETSMYCGERIARFLCFKSSFLKDELFLLKTAAINSASSGKKSVY